MLANPRRRKLGQALASLVAVSLLATSGCAKLYHALHYNCVAEAMTDHHRLYYHSPSTGRIITKKRAEDCRVELPCYGYSSTCWRKWPDGCEKCPVESDDLAPIVNAVPAESVAPGSVVEPTPAAAPAADTMGPDSGVGAADDSGASGTADDASGAVQEDEANLRDLESEEASESTQGRAESAAQAAEEEGSVAEPDDSTSNKLDDDAPADESPADESPVAESPVAESSDDEPQSEVTEPAEPADAKDADPLDDSDILGVPPLEDSGAVERPFEKSPSVPMAEAKENSVDASMAEAAARMAATAAADANLQTTLPGSGMQTGEAAFGASKELSSGSGERAKFKIAVTAPPQQSPAAMVNAKGASGLVVLPASSINPADLVKAVSNSKVPVNSKAAGAAPIRVQADRPASVRFVTEQSGTQGVAPVVRRADDSPIRFR